MNNQNHYDFKTIEQKWQDSWYAQNIYEARDNSDQEKKYILVEFPFPSGASLHMGHLFRYTVPDIYSRFLRHQGYNVLFPMGWDAFGLPAEEYARKTGKNPRETTEENIAKFKEQIKRFGFGVDWGREFSTTDPEYYKWTQWLFKKFYQAGLAEQREVELWYCENLGTVLANEEVYDGPNGEKLSERGDHPVERKKMKQWVLKITEYGDKLLEGLEETKFPEHIKAMQRSWIGKSEGTIVDWEIVPEDYIDRLASYPRIENRWEGDTGHDYTKLTRERGVLLVRIKDTDKFVAFKRKIDEGTDKHFWFLPGGAQDVGETPFQAAFRETQEEVGLESPRYLTDLGSFQGMNIWSEQKLRSLTHYFLCEITMEEYENRLQAVVDDPNSEEYGEVGLVTKEELLANNWQELDLIIKGVEEYDQTGEVSAVRNQNKDIMLATTNASKVARFHKFINFNGVNLKSPTGDLYEVNISENGDTELENAKIKAKAFFDAQGEGAAPSLALDTGIYFEGVPEDRQPGKHTKRAAGVVEGDSREVAFDKMTKFYFGLVEEFGKDGELPAYFLDSYALYDGFGYYTEEVKRPIIVTNKINDKDDLNFPLCSIYKTTQHGKYHNTLNASESEEFLHKSMKAARDLLFAYVYRGEQATPLANEIRTFTTRVDTLPSSTFVVVAPEFPGLLELTTTEFIYEVEEYINRAKNKSERERQMNKEKTGVFTGRFVRNPLTNMLCPVWVSDFVLGGYGTGAVMGDAHDERDVELGLEKDIVLYENVSPDGKPRENMMDKLRAGDVYTDKEGTLYQSGQFDGLDSGVARVKITDYLIELGLGERQTNWRFRDWVFSRQRYWGEPFPLEYRDGQVELVPDEELPLTLPELENFQPSKDGRSPLADSDWINVVDDSGNIIATREADTMPNWAGSSWYYLRFTDPKNSTEFASQKNLKYWLPVDRYFGGGEHTTMHLLYSRFWHRFLYDQGLVPTSEPYMTRINGGILLGPDGSKMSKSKGNVIQPDEKLETVGADALRLYTAFIGPYDATVVWQDGGLVACKKLVDTVWKLADKVQDTEPSGDLEVSYHKYLKQVTQMMEDMKTNTAVAQIMTFTNKMKEVDAIPSSIWIGFLITLAPFAPHITEECWSRLNYDTSIHTQRWPDYDESKTVDNVIQMAVQVNGKVRAQIQVAADASEEEILESAKQAAAKHLEGKELKFHKIIPGKLVTLVVK